MKKSGFSAVELLVVVGIIALISLISIPLLLNYQKTTKLRSEARVLATNLRLTQQLAITEQTIYNLELFLSTDSYQVINSETSEVIKDVTLDSEVSIYEVNDFTGNTIQYNSTGGVLETGSIVLTNTKNETSTLQIKFSGYVEISEQ
jgi:prepilin-type N-terminal cleavage/methylation domain-containing protein